MESGIIVTVISGTVSLVVAYFTAHYKFNHDRQLLETQLNQRHLERILVMRLENYAQAFDITEPIRRMSKDAGGINPREELLKARTKLWEWKSGQVSLIMSKATLERFYQLNDCLKVPCENTQTHSYSAAQIEKIIDARNLFRSQLRADLGTREADNWRKVNSLS